MNKKRIIIAIIVLFIDQLTKILIENIDSAIEIIKGYFRFVYVENDGAAWSILSGKVYFLVLLSIVMLVLVYKLSFSFKEKNIVDIGFGLLYGGILGNLCDRVFFGYVRDFISIKIITYEYPVFNIADMGIVIGIFLLIIDTFIGGKKDEVSSRKRKGKNRQVSCK